MLEKLLKLVGGANCQRKKGVYLGDLTRLPNQIFYREKKRNLDPYPESDLRKMGSGDGDCVTGCDPHV